MIQLQNFVSLTTTGTSGAATLSNGVLNVPNYDTSGGGAWVDYSATSTIVGWSSFTTKQIRYRIIGKQMFVQFCLNGTSNSTSTSFTLPNNAININESICPVYYINNGVTGSQYTYGRVNINTNTFQSYTSLSGATWTASGSKLIQGQFFIEIA